MRWLCNLLWGPLCDQGTCFGQTGCLRRARWQTKSPVPKAWDRPLRWCHQHGAYGDPLYVDPLTPGPERSKT